jgi:hypothetical protein
MWADLGGSVHAEWMRGVPVALAVLLLATACGAPAGPARQGGSPRGPATVSTAAPPHSRAATPPGTLTDAYHLPPLGAAAATPPVTDIWSASR